VGLPKVTRESAGETKEIALATEKVAKIFDRAWGMIKN
jgi:hypothetical protein